MIIINNDKVQPCLKTTGTGSRQASSGATTINATTKKHVKFSKAVRAKKVMGRKKYTTEEHEKTWYDFDELEQIRLDIDKEVKQVKDGVVVDENGLKVNQRGLDAWINFEKIKAVRKQARNAVFQIQRQYQHGSSSNCSTSVTSNSTISSIHSTSSSSTTGSYQDVVAMQIAAVYGSQSKACIKEAQVVGMKDAKVAHAIAKMSKKEKEDERLEKSCESRATAFLAARRQRMKAAAARTAIATTAA